MNLADVIIVDHDVGEVRTTDQEFILCKRLLTQRFAIARNDQLWWQASNGFGLTESTGVVSLVMPLMQMDMKELLKSNNQQPSFSDQSWRKLPLTPYGPGKCFNCGK